MTTSELLTAAANTVRIVPYSGPRRRVVYRDPLKAFIASYLEAFDEQERLREEFWRRVMRPALFP